MNIHPTGPEAAGAIPVPAASLPCLSGADMRFHALACDYDGTLAHDGVVADSTVKALERFRVSGRRLVMVTGRELPQLREVFPRLDLFEWVVAENGGLLFRPSTGEETPLAPPPPEAFLQALRDRRIAPLSTGRVIVATREPHEKAVLQAIHEQGLELQVIFNKGAVMVLPAGVNKASGLTAVLKKMQLSPHNVAGVGDAENDHAFLRLCECSVAVANALPAVKETVDLTTRGHHGGGVEELIDALIADDLRGREDRLARSRLTLGTRDGDAPVTISSYGPVLLIAGPSASGKSTIATGFLEELVEGKYQFCLIDPEGDYETFEEAILLGSPKSVPTVGEVLRLLEAPDPSAVVSLIGIGLEDRPKFFQALLGELLQLRARTGRPHWLIFDEAHHLMPASWQPPAGALPEGLGGLVLITVHPDLLPKQIQDRVDTLLAVGDTAADMVREFVGRAGGDARPIKADALEPGEALLWSRAAPGSAVKVRGRPPRTERRRHLRKYAEGALPPDSSFYFQGPGGKLNLRAQNLLVFLQMADGVDDDTWVYHLRRGDYSRWFREHIKDEVLAAEAERVEKMPTTTPAESRGLIRAAIERDYTLPAEPPPPTGEVPTPR